jgi:hypothetical protein
MQWSLCGLALQSMNLVEKINYAIQSYERSAKAWELKIDQEVVPVAAQEKVIQLLPKMRSLRM